MQATINNALCLRYVHKHLKHFNEEGCGHIQQQQ